MDAASYESQGFDPAQRSISLRWDTRPFWPLLSETFGVNGTGAALIADLCMSGSRLSYSRTSRHYDQRGGKYREPLYTYRLVVSQVDLLEAGGWINHDRTPPGRRGRQSSLQARPELIERFAQVVDQDALRLTTLREVIRLKDRAGNLIDYHDNRRTIRMRRGVEELNEAISGAGLHPSVSAPVVRIFTEGFDRNGRLYAMGNSWQNMKAEARKQIIIAGEAVVELDFKTMHPALLYARMGAVMPSDCYAIDGFHRDLVKRGLLILINARNEVSARMAIATTDAMELHAPSGSQAAYRKAHELIQAIKRVHHPIAYTFHQDMGLQLMAEDAAIAAEVVAVMLAKGIVVLPIHDSFLVPASKARELESAMIEAAQKVAKVTLMIVAK